MKSDGFLNIYKPKGITSHDVVFKVRKKLGIKKIGHSGTLDPFAEGVLVIALNNATRLIEYIPDDKEYLAEILFGLDTDTNDITGNILKEEKVDLDLRSIENILTQFVGRIKQRPPIYSAIKIKGIRAYNLARNNKIKNEDIKEKEIEIFSIDIIDFKKIEDKYNLMLDIHCSSGTYIRSIARDLGEKLNTCAVLSSLKRTKIGKMFTVANSLDLETLNKDQLEMTLVPSQDVINFEKIILSKPCEDEDILHGRYVNLQNENIYSESKPIQIISSSGKLIAIGFIENNLIKPKKVFK